MTDKYLSHDAVVKRLYEEYMQHGGLYVALDFDNTVYDYHKRGETYNDVIELVRRLSKVPGVKICVWTGTSKERYDFVREYLKENDIPFDFVNENPPFFKSSSPKIFYSILLDDRAGLLSAYEACCDFLNLLK